MLWRAVLTVNIPIRHYSTTPTGTLPKEPAKTIQEILGDKEVATLEEEIRKRTVPGELTLTFEKVTEEEEEKRAEPEEEGDS